MSTALVGVDLIVQTGFSQVQIGNALKPSALQMVLDVGAVPTLMFSMPQTTFAFQPRLHEVVLRLNGSPVETVFKVAKVTRTFTNNGIMQAVSCEGIVSYLADVALAPTGVATILAAQAAAPTTCNLYTNAQANASYPSGQTTALQRLTAGYEVHGAKSSLAGTLSAAMLSGAFITLADAFGSCMWTADGTRCEIWVGTDRVINFSAPIRGADRSAFPIDASKLSGFTMIDDKSAGAYANYIQYNDPNLTLADYTGAFNVVMGQANAVVQYQSGGITIAGQEAMIAASLEFTAGALSGSFTVPLAALMGTYWLGDLILINNTGDSNLDAIEWRIMSMQITAANGVLMATVGIKGAVDV